MEKTVSQKLKLILQFGMFTQEKAAQHMGVSFATFNSWIHEKSTPRQKHQLVIDNLYKKYTGQFTIEKQVLKKKQEPIWKFSKKQNIFQMLQQRKDLLDEFMLKLTYNSNRIEGSTLTEAETAQVIFTETALSNKPLREQIEAKNHQTAFLKILDAVGQKALITEEFILNIHQILMNGILPNAGSYRYHPVRIVGTQVVTANYLKIPQLMDKLVEDVQQSSVDIIYEITKFHADFEKIHPFSDGNGRLGRLIMQMMALGNGLSPILVLDQKKQLYYTYLEKAQNENDYSLLEDFFIDSILETIDLFE